MKNILFTLSILLIATFTKAQVFPIDSLSIKGRNSNRLNFVILPDGFTSTELPYFVKKSDTIQRLAFEYTPLKEYVNFFNVYTINVPSKESGVNHPATATDVTETDPVMIVDNYFGSTFDAGGTHRALVVGKPALVTSVLASNIPDYDIVLVLSNTSMYGGTGGKYATGTLHSSSVKIAVHELGHSFAGLADEYWSGGGYEKANMTAVSSPSTVKWKKWIPFKSVGVYPYGSSPTASKWFRPHQDCMMQYLDTVLCPVCKQTFINEIYNNVNPIDVCTPDTSMLKSAWGPDSTVHSFSVKLIKPIPNTFKIAWMLNGIIIPALKDTFATIRNSDLKVGLDSLQIFVTDTTQLARFDLPTQKGYQFSAKWVIKKSPLGIVTLNKVDNGAKFIYSIYPNPSIGKSVISYENKSNTNGAQYQLIDMSGRIVYTKNVNLNQGSGTIEIDMSNLAKGIYTFILKGSSLYVAEKLVLE